MVKIICILNFHNKIIYMLASNQSQYIASDRDDSCLCILGTSLISSPSLPPVFDCLQNFQCTGKLARQSQTGGSDELVRDRFNDWSYESVFHKTMSLVRDRFNDWSYESVFHKTMSLVRDRFNDWSYESVFHKTMSLVRDRFNDRSLRECVP